MGIDPAFTHVCRPLRPLSTIPNASDGPSLAQRKLAWHPCQAHGIVSMTSIQMKSDSDTLVQVIVFNEKFSCKCDKNLELNPQIRLKYSHLRTG
jgi:hypothetical protein